jgi:hypothetical protein
MSWLRRINFKVSVSSLFVNLLIRYCNVWMRSIDSKLFTAILSRRIFYWSNKDVQELRWDYKIHAKYYCRTESNLNLTLSCCWCTHIHVIIHMRVSRWIIVCCETSLLFSKLKRRELKSKAKAMFSYHSFTLSFAWVYKTCDVVSKSWLAGTFICQQTAPPPPTLVVQNCIDVKINLLIFIVHNEN